jgi:hypothetical protein
MNRRDFLELGAALVALPQEAVCLPANPGFRTRHLVAIILGNGARKKDVIGNEELSPFQSRMAREGTLFTEDYGETASLHGYMYTELLTGRDAPAQRPLYPTWNEYVRKKTAGRASEFWMLQGVSYYRAWTWDVKHFSRHPDYGIRYGATSLTMNKLFQRENRSSPREIVDRNVEVGLGHTAKERKDLVEWVGDALSGGAFELPSTVCDREVPRGDAQALLLAGKILKDFRPKIITVQVLGLDEAHAELGVRSRGTGYSRYVRHLKTIDELIGNLWAEIRKDPYLRDKTSLLIRPECGRDDEPDAYGQLGHGPGGYGSHYVWTSALGPDFPEGRVVTDMVERRDLAATITYLMTGARAEHATGNVRTQLFRDEHRMPRYRRSS